MVTPVTAGVKTSCANMCGFWLYGLSESYDFPKTGSVVASGYAVIRPECRFLARHVRRFIFVLRNYCFDSSGSCCPRSFRRWVFFPLAYPCCLIDVHSTNVLPWQRPIWFIEWTFEIAKKSDIFCNIPEQDRHGSPDDIWILKNAWGN
jgi:hypothetical protein